MTPHDLNRIVHIVFGVLALASGLLPLVSIKGGPLHRRAGQVFVWLALVNLGAAGIAIVFFDPPAALKAAFVAATYQYLSSLRALALKTRGPGWIEGLLILAGLAGCGWLFITMGPGTASWSPAIGYSTLGFTLLLCVYDASRYSWSSIWLRHARPLDHGLKMTGVYFAMMSAGVGNIWRGYQPWSQVGPSILGFIAMIVLTCLYLNGRKSTVPKPR